MKKDFIDFLDEFLINPKTKENINFKKLYSNEEEVSSYLNLLPDTFNSNDILSDYIKHYNSDAKNFDYFEEEYGKDTLEDFRRLRQYIYKLIPSDAFITLDVGSGNSWLSSEHIKNKRYAISMDVAEENIKKASDIYNSEYHIGIVGDALNPPFKENSIDCIVSSEVIEHIDNPTIFIQNMLKLLKKDGKLIISTPYKENIKYETCIHCNKKTPRNAHIHSFNEYNLKSLANNEISDFIYYTFGNKALLILQFHNLSKYFPFELWKITDKAANTIINKKSHIIAVYTK